MPKWTSLRLRHRQSRVTACAIWVWRYHPQNLASRNAEIASLAFGTRDDQPFVETEPLLPPVRLRGDYGECGVSPQLKEPMECGRTMQSACRPCRPRPTSRKNASIRGRNVWNDRFQVHHQDLASALNLCAGKWHRSAAGSRVRSILNGIANSGLS
jgi:hypothetical protein